MKFSLILLLLFVACASNAQRLLKPKKDKETGITITRTERARITPNKTKMFFGWEYYPVFVVVAKTDTNSIYLDLTGQTEGKFKMHKGDSVKLSMSDGNVLWLRNHYDTEASRIRMADGNYEAYWSNTYLLDAASLDVLRKNDVINIGVSSYGKKHNNSYKVDPKKTGVIRKAVMLVEKG